MTSSGYNPPTLEGWDKDKPGANGDDGHSITFRKKVGTTKIRMRFSLPEPASNGKPDGLAELKQQADAGLTDARKITPTLKVLEEKETTFRNFPAFLTLTHDVYRHANRERKIMRVADGKNTFLIDQTITGNPIDAAARTEADAAWTKMASDLQIKSSDGT